MRRRPAICPGGFEEQDGDERDRCGIEVDPADPPDAEHRGEIDQSVDRGQDNGSEDRFRQIGQRIGEKQQA